TQAEFNSMEFIVANKTLFMDDTDIDYDRIYEMLTPGSDAFKSQILVHPILIMYNTKTIDSLETKAKNKDELELFLKNYMDSKKEELVRKINEKLKKFPQIEKVYVDFFCFP